MKPDTLERLTRLADRVVGTIDVESDRLGAFSPEDERFLRTCAIVLRPLWEAAARR